MRISKVLLRRYKSFNVLFLDHPERRADSQQRPWNRLGFGDLGDSFGFIEIPIEPDITTIVGANESGKSHLLSAISKVASGQGGPGDLNRGFGRTDLCHFSSVDSANADVWPEIGVELSDISANEWNAITKISALAQLSDNPHALTLILANDLTTAAAQAHVFAPGFVAELDAASLNTLRRNLPTIRFIDARMAIGDHVDIGDLISEYGDEESDTEGWFSFSVAQEAAKALMKFAFTPGQPLDPAGAQELGRVKTDLADARMRRKDSPELEVLLFRDVLGVDLDTLKYLSRLPTSNRSYADSIIANWNRRIDERLNLSKYWQQDDQFNLRVDFKQGTLFFEITDKTGAVYTFRERSSGLRYFLSYYIQAKAIELAPDKPGVVLMDEPDSFLSIVGQRNLLSIFESLVSIDLSRRNTQLIYATHSPFLINRNFPRRVRLVRKGDGEEGTQYVDAALVRRYEPVRSALGIDCAQTMFMGATNLILEGAVDQFLLCELIRVFSDRSTLHTLLDLNSVVVVSAESAPRIPKLLDASRWEDEPNPAVVVFLDSDQEGLEMKECLTGRKRGVKRRLDPRFVLGIKEVLGESIDGHAVVTIEDVIPEQIYREAIVRYVKRYMPAHVESISELDALDWSGQGNVKASEAFFRRIESRDKGSYDKLGIAEEVIAVVADSRANDSNLDAVREVNRRLVLLCSALREALADSAASERRESTRQAVVRHLRSFLAQHRESASLFDLDRLIRRLQAEIEMLGKQDVPLGDTLRQWREELSKARAAGQDRVQGRTWKTVATLLRRLQHEPFGQVPVVLLASEVGAATEAQDPHTAVPTQE